MRIALDLTSTPRNKTGIGRYLYNLVDALQQVDQKNEYFLFIQSDDIEGFNILGTNFHCVTVNSKLLRKTYLRILWEQVVLPFRLKKLQIDLLHSPYFTMPYLSSIKNVVTFHDMTYFILPHVHTPIKREMFKTYIRLSSRKANAILAISNNTVDDIYKYVKLKDSEVYVTPMGVDERFFSNEPCDKEILSSYGIEQEYFLYVGTIEPRKNILRLLKAYNSLENETKSKYKLVISGKKGWMYDDIYKYISDNNLHQYIHFTGFVKDEHLPDLYRGAKIFLYVSIYEGFGIPVIESMASGIPCITSNIASMKEVAEESAFTIDPYNEDEIRDAIIQVLNDEKLYEDLRNKGRKRASVYTWKECARKSVLAYEKVMGISRDN